MPVDEEYAADIALKLKEYRYPPELVKVFLAQQERTRIRDLNWHDALWLLSMARKRKESEDGTRT